MSQHNNDKKTVSSLSLGTAMVLGLVLGGLVGILIDNMIIFAGGGMMLGLAVGLVFEKRKMSLLMVWETLWTRT